MALFFATSCSKDDDATIKTYAVTFDSNGGSAVEKQDVKEGEKAKLPTVPTLANYSFNAWKLDNSIFDFDTKITKDITLAAEWAKTGDVVGSSYYGQYCASCHKNDGKGQGDLGSKDWTVASVKAKIGGDKPHYTVTTLPEDDDAYSSLAEYMSLLGYADATKGKVVYTRDCVACHKEDGTGAGQDFNRDYFYFSSAFKTLWKDGATGHQGKKLTFTEAQEVSEYIIVDIQKK